MDLIYLKGGRKMCAQWRSQESFQSTASTAAWVSFIVVALLFAGRRAIVVGNSRGGKPSITANFCGFSIIVWGPQNDHGYHKLIKLAVYSIWSFGVHLFWIPRHFMQCYAIWFWRRKNTSKIRRELWRIFSYSWYLCGICMNLTWKFQCTRGIR